MVFHIITCIDHHLLPRVREVFFSLEATELSGEAKLRSGEKKYITHSQNDQLLRWPDSLVGRGLHRYRTGQIIAPIKVLQGV